MSTQTNQYFMYGLNLGYKWVKNWEEKNQKSFYDTFEGFCGDSAFKETVTHKEGIFFLLDGCNGKIAIVGRVIQKAKDGEYLADGKPMKCPTLTELEKELIQESVKRNFGVDTPNDYDFWFVTMYR